MKLLHLIDRPLGAVDRALRLVLAIVLLAMVALNVANAGRRYLFSEAIEGSDEILVFAMVWLVFLGAALVARDGRHLSFDLMERRMPATVRTAVGVLGDLLSLCLVVFVATQSYVFVERLAVLGQRSMAAGIPTAIPHTAVLVGLALTALALVVSLVRRISGTAPERTGETGGR